MNQESQRVWALPGMQCMVCDGSWDRGAVDTNRVRVVRRVVDGWRVGNEGCGIGVGREEGGCCSVM